MALTRFPYLHTLHRPETQHQKSDWIQAFFGPPTALETLPKSWDEVNLSPPSMEKTFLDHGYDETKPPTQWSALDYIEAASFRGGELLTADVTRGDTTTPLTWRCGFGHEFTGSPRLILTAGHWCPDCVKDTAGYPEQAHRNRFLGQLRTSPVSALSLESPLTDDPRARVK